jgi:hypothetical protein
MAAVRLMTTVAEEDSTFISRHSTTVFVPHPLSNCIVPQRLVPPQHAALSLLGLQVWHLWLSSCPDALLLLTLLLLFFAAAYPMLQSISSMLPEE